MSDYLFDGDGHDGDVDLEVETLELLLGGFAHDRALRKPLSKAPHRASTQPRERRVAWVAVAVAVAVAACFALMWRWPEHPAPEIARLSETDPKPGDRAPALDVPKPEANDDSSDGLLGQSCMALEDRSARLVIEDGHGCRLAKIPFPPGWAVQDGPGSDEGGRAFDCAYTFTVDEVGAAHLQVSRGAVILEGDGQELWVPAGTEVWWPADQGPGLPEPQPPQPAGMIR